MTTETQQLHAAILALEGQRALLGDTAVDLAVAEAGRPACVTVGVTARFR